MGLNKNTSNLFQSLYGLTEIDNKEIVNCLFISLLISLGITAVGGFIEFQPDDFHLLKWSLATIEHFSNALPFSIFLCLTGLVIVDNVKEAKMRSDRIREELKNEGRNEGRGEALEECKDWYENGKEYPPPWDTEVVETSKREHVNKSGRRRQ